MLRMLVLTKLMFCMVLAQAVWFLWQLEVATEFHLENWHNVSDEFQIGPDQIFDFRVTRS